MKKIAFIDTCFTGSTLPLIHQLTNIGIKVDLYEMASDHIIKEEAFTFQEIPCRKGIGDVPLHYYKHMSNYLPASLFRFRYLSLLRPFASVPILNNILRRYRTYCLKNMARKLNEENYDLVNFISQYWDDDYVPLIEELKCPKLVSMHEVCNHYNPDFKNTPYLLSTIFKKKIPIIVFSDKSRQDILKYKDISPETVHTMHFGCFESYKYMYRDKKLNTGTDYFLFFGYMKPYKGADIFAKAIKIILKQRCDIRFVIAGKGHDKEVEKIAGHENVTFINQFIENDDLVYLLKNSYAVVCPYRTASQSGIPQTAFVFNKPIIASSIGSFKEIIGENIFGILTEPESAEKLAEAIVRLWDNKETHRRLSDNIANFENIRPEYNWRNIAQQYLNITKTCNI